MQLVARLRADRPTDLTQLAMRMAVQVAAQVIGLTDSSVTGMSRRLGAFFASNPLAAGRGPAARIRGVLGGARTAHFYTADVKPAIRARRRQPREDIVSQLIERGFSDVEILTECITYAAAGMATTRELMSAAAWHLIDDAALLSRYRSADVTGRRHLLEELLRVEPVVGYLRRRTTRPYVIDGPDGPTTIAAGALVDLRLRVVNADPVVAGAGRNQCVSGPDAATVGAHGGDELRRRPPPLPRRSARRDGDRDPAQSAVRPRHRRRPTTAGALEPGVPGLRPQPLPDPSGPLTSSSSIRRSARSAYPCQNRPKAGRSQRVAERGVTLQVQVIVVPAPLGAKAQRPSTEAMSPLIGPRMSSRR